MNHAQLITRGLSLPGTEVRYPFDPAMPVLFVGSRMFALLGAYQGQPSANLKTDPETAWIAREQYAGTVIPGYHMNKKHWNTVLLNGRVPEAELLQMLEESYGLVLNKLPLRERQAIAGS
ncbi:MmcQ/YjbR family DNA-binding protein [Paenibacillus filicis]|uniref:MmcQ/YjbR family DNA-binding protein n=1 Tax=Paenibacillus gyeongsangnamensis TaxID=3388067 RepID=A0ABT4Q2M4_9BACL|nr:MmcQ/YjbR family DNA-binding protein [Paenibacillus filicis]MCZ8511094.1 MmcQ/YjbR family DNA-binding protein [Paenibacillus filicis]